MEGWRGTPTGGGGETPEPGFFGLEALSPEETSRPSISSARPSAMSAPSNERHPDRR